MRPYIKQRIENYILSNMDSVQGIQKEHWRTAHQEFYENIKED